MLGNGPHVYTVYVIFIMGRLGWVVGLSCPLLGKVINGPHVLGNGPHTGLGIHSIQSSVFRANHSFLAQK